MTHFEQRPLPDSNRNPLSIFSSVYGVQTFADVTEARLRDCYLQDRTLFWRVVSQLAFYGTTFTSEPLKSYTLVKDPEKTEYIWCPSSIWEVPLELPVTVTHQNLLFEYGILTKGSLLGIPVESGTVLVSSNDTFRLALIDEGFELLSQSEFLRRIQEQSVPWTPRQVEAKGVEPGHPLPLAGISQESNPRKVAIDGQVLLLDPGYSGLHVRKVFRRLAAKSDRRQLIRALESFGIFTLGDFPADMDAWIIAHVRFLRPIAHRIARILAPYERFGRRPTKTSRTHWAPDQGMPSLVHQGVSPVEVYGLPESLKDKELVVKEWPECPGIISVLRRQGIIRLGQLPENVESYLLSLRSVGVKKVTAFIKHLNRLKGSTGDGYPIMDTDLLPETMGVFDEIHDRFVTGNLSEKELRDRLQQVRRSELGILLNIALHVEIQGRPLAVYPWSIDKALSLMSSNTWIEGSTNLGVLSEALQAVPRTWIAEFYSNVSDLGVLPGERLAHTLQPFWELVRRVAAGERPRSLKEGQWRCYTVKIELRTAGYKPTLQELGQKLGLTRERARQLDSKISRILTPLKRELSALKQYVHNNGPLVDAVLLVPHDLTKRETYFALDLLERAEVYWYPAMSAFSTLSAQGLKDRVVKPMWGDLKDRIGPSFSDAQLQEAVKGYVNRQRFAPGSVGWLTGLLIQEYCNRYGDRMVWRGVSKQDLVVSVLQQFPRGLAVYREAAQLRERLAGSVPNLFTTDRAMIAALVNSPDIFLWGWGVYIHRDHITVTPDSIRQVVEWVQQQFRLGIPQLTVTMLYAEFEQELVEAGLPNEHALYTCLRLFHGDDLFLPKFPKIYPKGQSQNYTRVETLTKYLLTGPKSIEELRKEFVERRGWKDFSLQQALGISSSIIRSGEGEYALAGHFKISSTELAPLADYLDLKLEQGVETVSVAALQHDREAYCYKLGIRTPHLLYSLLQAEFAERFNFPRFPHVARVHSLTRQEVSNRKLVAMYLRNRQDIVAKEELRYEFVERRYWTERALENGLLHPEILPYTRGLISEYVHRETIGWNAEKAAALGECVGAKLNELRTHTSPVGRVRDLLNETALPRLERGIAWTEDMLGFLLEEIDSLLLLGTKRALYSYVPNPHGIDEDIGFISYVLKTEFNGSTSVAVLEGRLAKLEFCKVIPESYLKGPGLPYRLVGNEIISNDLRVISGVKASQSKGGL
jgi:hypothetical protein